MIVETFRRKVSTIIMLRPAIQLVANKHDQGIHRYHSNSEIPDKKPGKINL